MRKVIILSLFALCFGFANTALAADDPLMFDSTDHYLGACQFTDTSEWTLAEDLTVTTFRLWYRWNQDESTLPVTITKDGQDFASFTATRGQCDPYQQSWCNAEYSLNMVMPKGTYTTHIPESRQCLKPGVTGTVLLYGFKGGSADIDTAVVPIPSGPDCSNSNFAYAIVSFAVGSAAAYFVGRKLAKR